MTRDFLKHIWPSQGFYCIAVPKKKSDGTGFFYDQKVYDDIETAAKASEAADRQGKDCFMAVGSLLERFVVNEDGKKQIRVHKNMGWFRSLIFDIDCGKGKPYETQIDAVKALKQFIKDTDIAKPTLVSSGGGLHVYFTLDEDITADEWFDLAVKLKAIASHFELDVDNSRTSDKSSVLRVVGTHNHKKEVGRPVRVLAWGDPQTPDKMRKTLDFVIKKEHIKLSQKKKFKPKTEVELAFAKINGNVEQYEKADGELVVKRCPVMAELVTSGGHLFSDGEKVDEPRWRIGLSVSEYFQKPIPHELSVKDPDFDENILQLKLDGLRKFAPYTCGYIEDFFPDICRSCRYKGKVNSPIALGRVRKESDDIVVNKEPAEEVAKTISEPEVVIEPTGFEDTVDSTEETESASDFGDGDEDIAAPAASGTTGFSKEVVTMETVIGELRIKPPPPFKFFEGRGVWMVTEDEEEGLGEEYCIYEHDIYPSGLESDTDGGMYAVKVEIKLPRRENRQVVVPMPVFTNPHEFSKMLAENGVVIPQDQDVIFLLRYMKSYVNEILKLTETVPKHHQLGWHNEGESFVLTTKTLNSDGTTEKSSVSDSIARGVDGFRKKGTMEAWRKVIDHYARPGYERYAFGHLVGYGSLLFNFTIHAGAIVNMVGQTGSGKSTVLYTINSIFGHPEEPMLIHADTALAKINKLGIYNSICATYDEITNIDADELSDFCYSISQGRGRHRLNQNAEIKENNTKWKMILASTSNKSLFSTLSTLKHDSSAESMRVFEFNIPRMNVMTKDEAKIAYGPLFENYGHAGEPFMNYVIQHQEEVRKLIDSYELMFDEKANIPISERYWSSIVACVLAGADIVNRLDLGNFDIDAIADWAAGQIEVMRSIVSENLRDPVSILVEFMHQNIPNTITVREGEGRSTASVIREPRNGLVIRTVSDKSVSYIDRMALRNWMVKGGSDVSSVKKELKAKGILLNDNASKVLSAGSFVASSGQVRCWLIDLNHPAMTNHIRVPEGVDDTQGKENKVVKLDGIDKDEAG